MKKEDKALVIESLKQTIQSYSAFYLVDVTGLNSSATSDLRRKCFKSEVKMVVVKNTLLQKALDQLDADYSPLYDSLKGTTALMLSNAANAPAKLQPVSRASRLLTQRRASTLEQTSWRHWSTSRARRNSSPTSLHSCSHRPRTLFLLCSLVQTPSTESSRLLEKERINLSSKSNKPIKIIQQWLI